MGECGGKIGKGRTTTKRNGGIGIVPIVDIVLVVVTVVALTVVAVVVVLTIQRNVGVDTSITNIKRRTITTTPQPLPTVP